MSALLAFDGMARSTFYYHLKRMNLPDKHAETIELIKEIFHDNKGRYGYRRITAEIRNRGYIINHKTIHKLMKQCGLKCQPQRVKYKSYKGEIGKIAPNVLNRNFTAEKPNCKWVTDVTQFAVCNQKVYLSPILDLYNGEIISYDISLHPSFNQVTNMLNKAFKKVPDLTNVVLHSDQGWQYQMKQYQRILKSKGIIQSMSRKGNCLDNSVMENFFGILKTEMYYGHEFSDVNHLIKEIEKYIEYYNNNRIKIKLNGLSPVNYRVSSMSTT